MTRPSGFAGAHALVALKVVLVADHFEVEVAA